MSEASHDLILMVEQARRPERKESAGAPNESPRERKGIWVFPPGQGRDSEIRTQGYPVRGMYGGLGPASGAGHCF